MSTYVNVDFNKLTPEQHAFMLRRVVATSLKYMDGETFKTILLAQQDNYLLELINSLANEGKLNG